MKDIHSHLIYGIDDGTSNIEDSIYIIKELSDRGYTDLILTPHFIEGTNYNANNKDKEVIFNELKKYLSKRNINTNIYLGNEIFISTNIHELIVLKQMSTLASSKYILIEYSLYKELPNAKDILLDLIEDGYKPILAHPERYEYYKDSISYFKDLVSKGILLQGNLLSLIDNKNRKQTLIKLLEHNLIYALASDIHNKEDLKLLDKSLIELDKVLTKDKQKELLDININKIIENI